MEITNPNIYKMLVQHFGSQAKTANALGVTQPSVSYWIHGIKGMSYEVASLAQIKTNGKFKADELCPKFKSTLEQLST